MHTPGGVYSKILSTSFFIFVFLFIFNFSFAEKVSDLKATDYVNDFASVLSVEQKDELSKTLGDLEKQTGDQVAVVIVNKMEDEYGNTDYIEHYAVKLFEKWGMGKNGTDENSDKGVLFLVSIQDRQMRIEVGYGLEPTLTDGITKNILDNFVRPEFKNQNYYEGVKVGVENIATVLNGGTLPENTDTSNYDNFGNFFQLIILLFIFGINIFGWLFAIMARTKSWWLGGVVTFFIGFPILYYFFGLNIVGDFILFIFTLGGFLFDYLVSKNYKYWQSQAAVGNKNARPAWWAGGGWGPGSGGFSGRGGSGFGGFGGGGMSGGGGSSSSW